MSLNDHSCERQPAKTAGVCAPLYVDNSCVSVATFGVGSWYVVFRLWEVYKTRAIDIQLYRKAQLTEHIEGSRDSVPCWCMVTSFCYSLRWLQFRTMQILAVFRLSLFMCSMQSENLCNLEIALQILRIYIVVKSRGCATIVCNLQIAQIIHAHYSWYRSWLANCSTKGWKTTR